MDVRRGRKRKHTLLPLRSSRVSNTISCYYCDFKICVFNKPLFSFGQRYARWLKKWFAIGVGFSLAALFGVTVVVIWEVFGAVFGYGQSSGLRSMWSVMVMERSSGDSGMGISFSNFLYLCVSTLVAVTVHELGHAVAAASEGIQMEYISVFLAVLFPGALVALNWDVMQVIHKSIALRVYCAGIWHNAVCCVVTALALILLPLLLSPLYVHQENPVVISVLTQSSLSGYLSPGDVILTLDGVGIRRERDWVDAIAVMDEDLKHYSVFSSSNGYKPMIVYNRVKGYCIPQLLVEEGKMFYMSSNTSACPYELTEFIEIGCNEPIVTDDSKYENTYEVRTCLAGSDVVKHPKCGKAWLNDNISSCPCQEEDFCMSPIQSPGQAWVEISYSKPYSTNCSQKGEQNPLSASHTDSIEDNKCGGTFVYIGDLNSLAQSVHLTEYQPRWPFPFSFPAMLGKFLVCTFYTSLALAVLNSLPVYFLDGEAILEVIINHSTYIHPSKRPKLLKVILIIGTVMSTFVFIRSFISVIT